MPLTVGTDTYISVADAKTEAQKFSEEGVQFAGGEDNDIEELLKFSLAEIEDLEFRGRKDDPNQTLSFPRNFWDEQRDPSGNTLIKKVQVLNAIAIGMGMKRNLERNFQKSGGPLFEDVNTFSPLASDEAYFLLRSYRYLAPKRFSDEISLLGDDRFKIG